MWPWKWRKVRTAQISKEDRDFFERYGEAVIGSVLANLSTPTAPELRSINAGSGKVKEARDWLTECRDAHEQREQRLEFVEWAILLFILLEIGLSIVSLGHSRSLGIIRGAITGSIVPRAQAALLQQTNPAAVASTTSTAAQKPAPAQSTEQQKLKERVDTLESQLKEAQAKADRAAMEKDYITRVQKQYEAYYKEVFGTQTHILWTIGITVTLLSVTLSVVFFVAGRFGFNLFDRKIDSALRDATTQLRTEFTERLAKETGALREANSAQLKTLQEGLQAQIAKEIAHLEARSACAFYYSQGLSFGVAGEHTKAREYFRGALEVYVKSRESFRPTTKIPALADIFRAIQYGNPENFLNEAKKELADDLYNDLGPELNAVAIDIDWLVPLLKERK